MVYITYNIYYEALQAKYRTLTPNTNETVAFFTHPYAFAIRTQYPI